MKQPVISEEVIAKIEKWNESLAASNDIHIPWVTVKQVNKVGRRHLHKCPKQKRKVHLLSDGERRAYKILMWRPETIQIDEQVPLDLNETLAIAEELGYIHPRNWETNTAHVMSSDLVAHTVDFSTGEVTKSTYSFKYSDQIWMIDDDGHQQEKHYRVWQKLHIEQVYSERHVGEYAVITEQDATKELAWNIDWFTTEANAVVSDNDKLEFVEIFQDFWVGNPFSSLKKHIVNTGKVMSLDFKRSQTIFKHVALHGILKIDLSQKLFLCRPLELLK
jgi:hypothetical protein